MALPETDEDIEGFVIEKAFLYERVFKFIEKTFNEFIILRIQSSWNKSERQLVHRWIHQNNL